MMGFVAREVGGKGLIIDRSKQRYPSKKRAVEILLGALGKQHWDHLSFDEEAPVVEVVLKSPARKLDPVFQTFEVTWVI